MTRTITAMLLLVVASPAGVETSALYGQSARPDVMVLSPEAGEKVPVDAVLVALSLNGEVVDSSSVTIAVDGNDVTAGAEITGTIITWRPTGLVEPGPHRVVVNARDKAGREIDPVAWIFNVTPGTALAVAGAAPAPRGMTARMHGSMIVEGSGNSVSGAGAAFSRQEDFLPRAWLNFGGVIAPGWSYGARVHASGYETKFEQPVNRYRADLRAPFFAVAVGDVNPFYQSLILAGTRVRGVQGDVKAGPLRLSAVTGKTRRAIPGVLDVTLPGNVLRSGTFGQDLFAIRPAIGSGDRFQFGATFMRVNDDVESIPDLRLSAGGVTDFRTANPPPKDNVVGGLDLTLRMFSGRVLMQYENAVSLLANDISGGPLTKSGLDSIFDHFGTEGIDIDPADFADIFTLNASLIPIDPRDLSNVAQQARASVRAGSHQLAFEWRSIGGAYHSLGNTSLQRDIRGFRIRDSFTMLNDALVLSAAYEQDHDNLDDSKPASTKSTGAYGTVAWQKSHDALLVTASARVGSRSNDLAAGSFDARDESNRAYSGGVSIPVPMLKALRTRVTLNTSFIERNDEVNPAFDTQDMYYLGGLQAESHDNLSQYALLFGLNRAELTSVANSKTDFRRILGTARHHLNERFTALLDATSTVASGSDTNTAFSPRYNRMELLGGGEYRHSAAAILTLTAGVVSYDDKRAPGNNTSEVLVRLRMSRAF